jgi:UDPglucose 6-dehydrogenase
MRLTMVGTGYVGLVTGVCLANTGNEVVCLDVDPEKIEAQAGRLPDLRARAHRADAQERRGRAASYTTDKDEAYRDAEMIFICVGTPSDDRGHTDLKYVTPPPTTSRHDQGAGPDQTPKTIVMKSTVPSARRSPSATASASDRRPRTSPSRSPTTPSSSRRATRSTDFNKPDRVVVGVENGPRGRAVPRPLRPVRPQRAPHLHHGHPVRRDGQVRLQQLPGDQDLVHQRDGQPLRGLRRQHQPRPRGHVRRQPHRARSSSTRAWATAARASPRTPSPAS